MLKSYLFFFLFLLHHYTAYSQPNIETVSADSTRNSDGFALNASTISEIALPSAMIAYGFVSLKNPALRKLDYNVRNAIAENNTICRNKIDDFMQFAPGGAAFILKVFGVQSKHKYSQMLILYAACNLLETGATYSLKSTIRRDRPTGSGTRSFPSGHTATAFVAAEFLHQEYKDESPWISIGGYGVACLTGLSRIFNDVHWVSDVIAGAGIGILSTKIVYKLYPLCNKNKKRKDSQALIFPGYAGGNLNINCAWTF